MRRRWNLFGWLNSRNRTERQVITTEVMYYDSYTDVDLYWGDILEVLSLVEKGNEESVKKLKRKYQLENKYGEELYVTLNTVQLEKLNRDVYPGDTWDFTLTDVQKMYEKELINREEQKEREKKKKEEQEQYNQRNAVPYIQKKIKEYTIHKK